MKYPEYDKETAALLERKNVVNVEDFVQIYKGLPLTSVYARIRALVLSGKLSVVGKGDYLTLAKPSYQPKISAWMQECSNVMIGSLEGVIYCITERKGNLEVEVCKTDMEKTMAVLQKHFPRVMYRRDAKYLAQPPVDFVLVGRLISEAPVFAVDGIGVPSPEKELVDTVCRKEDAMPAFQRMMEVYPVNRDRLRRYASRRGVEEEVAACMGKVNQNRVKMFEDVQRYLAHTPVVRAWVFGSFARGEETEGSDLDLLVDYDKSKQLSLLGIVRYKLDLEQLIGREVDLVENGYLKPFAAASANQDKYLIYERKGQ